MVTDRELPLAAIDDRSYLYPHAWSPPLFPLPNSQTDKTWPPELVLVPGYEVAAPEVDEIADYSNERAVIGNALRIPVVWCEFGSCIARFAAADALGESDVRTMAVAAGWRQDALGRLACPECVQADAMFMVVYPLVPARHVAKDVPAIAEALPARQSPRAAREVSVWERVEPPRLKLAVTAQREPSRLAWWGHRDVGRHREK